MEEALAVNKDKKSIEINIQTTANALVTGPFGALSPYLKIQIYPFFITLNIKL
jgi:hypothetical protein